MAAPLSDSKATASELLTYAPDIASLAPICNHAELTDCADHAAHATRTGEGLGDAERGSAECGSSERHLIVAATRRREAVLCSARPCATPFRLSGKNETYFEESKEEESNLKHFQVSGCFHSAVLDRQIDRPYLL